MSQKQNKGQFQQRKRNAEGKPVCVWCAGSYGYSSLPVGRDSERVPGLTYFLPPRQQTHTVFH